MASPGGLWAFYYIQGEEGEDRSHPNAFRLAPQPAGADVTLADVLRAFPLADAARTFHFRFRLNAKAPGGKGSTFYWLDVTSPSGKVPLSNGRVILKLLRLQRPVKQGLLFRRKPVLKWAADAAPRRHKSGSGASSTVQPSSGMHRSSSASSFERGGRPAKYSDRATHVSPPASMSGSETQHSAASTHSVSADAVKKPMSRSGSSSKAEEPTSASLEDFLSGGQQPGTSPSTGTSSSSTTTTTAPATSKTNVDLMSDSSWGDAPASTANTAFLSSMDPLAPPKAQLSPGSTRSSPSREPPTFEDDAGQTVGPVSIAEMQAHMSSSSDGSNVYNARLVDKSAKSVEVRRAMEERERKLQEGVDKAREALRQREETARNMAAQKESVGAVLGPKLKAWAEDNGRVKNIRTLLSTMHQVMWDGSRWQEVGMGKLLQPQDVKKQYRKAMIVVHPDKSGGRSAEQLLIAERVFAAVNSAWEDFQKANAC